MINKPVKSKNSNRLKEQKPSVAQNDSRNRHTALTKHSKSPDQ